MSEPSDTQPRDADRLIYAGLLGLAAAAVIQMGDRESLTAAQEVCVFAFAVAIPLLAVGLVTDYARRTSTPIPRWRDALGAAGALAAVVGFGSLFFHFGVVVGVLFAAGCLLGVLLIRSL
jgi:hypothetical protein